MELVGLSSEPFYQGIMASFSALAVLQILVFFGVLRFCARQPERLKFEKKPPLNLFASNLSEQLKEVTSTTETCNWFNDLLSSVYFELLGSETMRKLVRESIEQELKELKEENPTLLDNLEVEHIDLGTHLPELRNVRVRSTDGLKTDMFLVFDLSYTGGASISVKITSFGKSMSVNVSLSRIEGKLVAEIIDWPVPCIQMYFYSEPQFNFSLKFGEEKFKWFAEIVSQRLKQFLIKKVVYPNGLVYHFTRRGQEWHTMIKDRMPGSPDLLNQPGTLALHLYEAKGLQSGTYTAVARVNKQKCATKFREGTSPVWNQTFCFDLRKLNPSETVITLQVRDSLKDKETSILGRVDIPLSSLRHNSAQFQSFKLLSAEADSQEVVGEIRIGFLMTTPEKTQFLSEISKFTKHQSMISMVKKANYDEKLGGYVMVTDGEKEEGCEPPTKSLLEGKRGSPDMDSLIKKTTMNFLHKLRNLDKKPAEKS